MKTLLSKSDPISETESQTVLSTWIVCNIYIYIYIYTSYFIQWGLLQAVCKREATQDDPEPNLKSLKTTVEP